MKANNIFRLTEKLLFRYKSNLARLDILKEDLRVFKANGDVKAQAYQLYSNFGGIPSDPVAAHVEKIISLENQIKNLERDTIPITRFVNDVYKSAAIASKFSPTRDFQALLDLFYFGGFTLSEVAESVKKSRRTLCSRRKSLVLKAADYLGL